MRTWDQEEIALGPQRNTGKNSAKKLIKHRQILQLQNRKSEKNEFKKKLKS